MNTPVKDLKSRYGIGKQAEITRRKYLGIVPRKVDGVYIVSDDQLSTLDALDQFLCSSPTAKMSNFPVESSESTIPSESKVYDVGEATLVDSSESSLAVNRDHSLETSNETSSVIYVERESDPIKRYKDLIWLADNKIMITTKEVQKLVGARPNGKTWVRGSFTFTRGDRVGNGYGWLVSRK